MTVVKGKFIASEALPTPDSGKRASRQPVSATLVHVPTRVASPREIHESTDPPPSLFKRTEVWLPGPLPLFLVCLRGKRRQLLRY